MHYFAYGTNMDTGLLREVCPAHRMVGMAELHDYDLAFTRFSQRWGGGVASVQSHHGGLVYGVLYELNDEDMASLDAHEGFRAAGDQHNAFDREMVNVELVRPDDGSFQRRVRAWLYVARPSNPSPPSRRYLDVVVNAAKQHGLPDEYVEALNAIPADEAAG